MLVGGVLTAGGGLLKLLDFAHVMHRVATSVLLGLGLLFVIFGVFWIILAYDLYKGRSWARLVALFFTVISLFFGIFGILFGVGILRVAIDVIIIYYLTSPNVKSFFKGVPSNKRVVESPSSPPPPPPP
ncbi:MAG: hypothetical protein ACUVQ5_04775 [Candidatus Methanomethylicaceae archaeon]